MKLRVMMKDPDTLDDAIKRAVDDSFKGVVLEDEELDAAAEARREKVKSVCSTWFKWGEYLEVEIDTEAKTCTVVPCR
jgi:hypothetical protein